MSGNSASNQGRVVELTPCGQEELDWNKVVDLRPQGYVELNDGENIIHGPIEDIHVNDVDFVVITLKWAATMPCMGNPGFGKWKNLPDAKDKTIIFPNLAVTFVIEGTLVKGPRVRFGMNILYFDKIDGIDPANVEGLVLG
jgi:hypothetical protein